MKIELKFRDIGLVNYDKVFEMQTNLFKEKITNKLNGTLTDNIIIICEHPHVFTNGKSGNENNLLVDQSFLKTINAVYHISDRGGDITYHGQGQLVVYPIIDLDIFKLGTKDYIYKLEYIIIDILKKYEINGEINTGKIGVWLDVRKITERKICSIGVKVSRGITMHGLALNVNTDLSYFKYINPCGFIDKSVTSIEKELGYTINIEEIKKQIIEHFQKNLIY